MQLSGWPEANSIQPSQKPADLNIPTHQNMNAQKCPNWESMARTLIDPRFQPQRVKSLLSELKSLTAQII